MVQSSTHPVLVNVIILPPPHSKQLSVPVHFMQFAINVLESAHFLHLLFRESNHSSLAQTSTHLVPA